MYWTFKKIIFQNSAGSTLIMVAIFLPVALVLLALTINVGTMYYVKSAYTSIGNTATASGLSILGDKIVEVVQEKQIADPSFIPVSPLEDNLTDADRDFLTTDSTIINDIKNTTNEYLQKNISTGAIMRNDFILKDVQIAYPYEYHSGDNVAKVHLEFQVESPISLIKDMEKKDILIKAEAQMKIK
jgi:vacuolar-type H+-ATPase subunit F/Vma7